MRPVLTRFMLNGLTYLKKNWSKIFSSAPFSSHLISSLLSYLCSLHSRRDHCHDVFVNEESTPLSFLAVWTPLGGDLGYQPDGSSPLISCVLERQERDPVFKQPFKLPVLKSHESRMRHFVACRPTFIVHLGFVILLCCIGLTLVVHSDGCGSSKGDILWR